MLSPLHEQRSNSARKKREWRRGVRGIAAVNRAAAAAAQNLQLHFESGPSLLSCGFTLHCMPHFGSGSAGLFVDARLQSGKGVAG